MLFFFALASTVHAQPRLLMPPSASTYVSIDSTRFTWTSAPPEYDDYDFFLSCNGWTLDPIVYQNTTDTTVVVPSLMPGMRYYWWVSAHKPDGRVVSETWTFITELTQLQAPILHWPLNGGKASGTGEVYFEWEPSQGSGSEFVLQVSEDSTFSPQVPMAVDVRFTSEVFGDNNGSPCKAPRVYFQVEHTQLHKTYYWRVKEANYLGASDWSEVWRFTTIFPISTEASEGLPEAYRLEPHYPNPVRRQTTIAFSLPHRSHVAIQLYDMAGKQVATLTSGTYPAGTFRLDWNLGHLPSGVYVYQLQAGAFTEAQQLVLRK